VRQKEEHHAEPQSPQKRKNNPSLCSSTSLGEAKKQTAPSAPLRETKRRASRRAAESAEKKKQPQSLLLYASG